jgi:hypothetical protein
MSWYDYPLIAISHAVCAAIGALAGALATVKAFLIMHANSLPPDYRPKGRK